MLYTKCTNYSHDYVFLILTYFILIDICLYVWLRFRFMVFNATFNNISVIAWWLDLLVEETEPDYQQKTTDFPLITDKLYHKMLYRVYLAWTRFELTTLVVIGTDCTSSCKSNYHTIMTTSSPVKLHVTFDLYTCRM